MTLESLEKSSIKRKRTWGREVALCGLIFMGVLAWEGKIDALNAMSIPLTPLITAAFLIKNEAVESRIKK